MIGLLDGIFGDFAIEFDQGNHVRVGNERHIAHLAVIEIRRLFILAFLGQCQDLVAESAEFGDVAVQRVE